MRWLNFLALYCTPSSGFFIDYRRLLFFSRLYVEQEDVDEGRLDHNQFCAINGMTLDEAREHVLRSLVAVYLDAPLTLTGTESAARMYEALRFADGMIVDEPDEGGLFCTHGK